MPQSGSLARQLDVAPSITTLMKAERRPIAKDEVYAVEYIRRMRGGSQSRLIRCSDRARYVVKVQNNPLGKRTLANELLGNLLATRLSLPTAKSAVVQVSKEFIQSNEEMVIELLRGREPMHPGPCFGSRFLQAEKPTPPGIDPLHTVTCHLTAGRGHMIENITDVAGFLVFDKWTGNIDRRQTIAVRSNTPGYYRAVMIDQGFCFSGDQWTFRDSPLYGIDLYRSALKWIPSFSIFELWLDRLEHIIDRRVIETAANKIPPQWYDNDRESLQRLLDRLDSRRAHVADLVWSAWEYARKEFPNWKVSRNRIAKLCSNDARQLRLADFDTTATNELGRCGGKV